MGDLRTPGSELPRTLLLGASVNKPLVDVPDPAWWHHAWCRPIGETRVGKEDILCRRKRIWLWPAVSWRRAARGLGRDGTDDGPRLRRPHPGTRPRVRPRGLQAPSCRVCRRLLRSHLHHRGPGSRRRQDCDRFIVRGTHDRREFMGVAPTGREVTNIAIAIHRISEGKIAEEWDVGTSISELRKGIVARWQLSFS